MDAKQRIIKESKRSMHIWVGGVVIWCLILAVGFTFAELKGIKINADSDYRLRMFWHIIKSYWIQVFAAPAVLYLIFTITIKHFLRMIDNLTPGEQLRYLETYMHFPWYNKMHPNIVYSDKFIYVSSTPLFLKTKKISIGNIKSVSCNQARSMLVSIQLKNGSDIYFICSKWDTLALYVLFTKGKIPEIRGIIPEKEFRERLIRKEKHYAGERL